MTVCRFLYAACLSGFSPVPQCGYNDVVKRLNGVRNSKSSIEFGERPRLLYVASSGGQGGIERHSVRLAQQFRQRGAWLRYACLPESFLHTQCWQRGVPTVPLLVRNSGDLGAVRRLGQTILQNEIDIVHVHSRRDYVPAALAVLLARRRSRTTWPRLILHAHMIRPLGDPPGLSHWFFGRTVDQILAVSGVVRDAILHGNTLPDGLVRVLPNGVETDAFAAPGDTRWAGWRQEQRQAWGICEQETVIGMVGRLDAKGQAMLLAAAPCLSGGMTPPRFVFVGSDGCPGEEGRLRAQANAAGIGDRVLFVGETEQIPQALAAFDILVHLPTDESFGLALAEAMAAGLPTVATDIGGCREVVRAGVTGSVTAPGDTAALTAALLPLLDPFMGPARRRAMGEAGQRHVLQNFSLAAQIDALENLYCGLFQR